MFAVLMRHMQKHFELSGAEAWYMCGISPTSLRSIHEIGSKAKEVDLFADGAELVDYNNREEVTKVLMDKGLIEMHEVPFNAQHHHQHARKDKKYCLADKFITALPPVCPAGREKQPHYALKNRQPNA